MARQNGPWTIKETICHFKDEFLALYEDQVIKPDGKPGNYAIVRMKPGVSVLPIDQDGAVYLTEQFRYVFGQSSIETVSGGVDEGEPPLDAARRELKEELGLEATDWTWLGTYQLDTSMVSNPVNLYLCRQLRFGPTKQEATEDIRTIRLPLEEAVQMVFDGRIVQAQSCLLLVKAHWLINNTDSAGFASVVTGEAS
jgi:8-oxo-dGTP pyrophosphatase MutT (NUDIX family)